jgi:hypothetical protein
LDFLNHESFFKKLVGVPDCVITESDVSSQIDQSQSTIRDLLDEMVEGTVSD